MGLPVRRVEGCVLDGISAVEHDLIAHINSHMGNAAGVISPLKKDQITGLRTGNGRTDVIESLRPQPSGVDQSAVGQHITDKTGTVKGSVRAASAPHIGIAEVFFRFGQ